VSTEYKEVDPERVADVSRSLRDSWRDADIPERQRQIVDSELAEYRRGKPVAVFDALVDILRWNVPDLRGSSLLEIGCSSGYYSEVLATKGIELAYEGCDYSEAFVALARRLYPKIPFSVQDAVKLSFDVASFDIVVSGGCLLHIPEYERAIAEAARVARKWVVFHRTPIIHTRGPVTYTKKAYRMDTFEIHFHEQALLRRFSRVGLRVVDVNTHSIGWDEASSDALAMKTYLCEKSGLQESSHSNDG
jgi:SAM-dependent methyltransferase